jgi:hypothetical protein
LEEKRAREREKEVAIVHTHARTPYMLYITRSINKEKQNVPSWDPFYRSSCNLVKDMGVSEGCGVVWCGVE